MTCQPFPPATAVTVEVGAAAAGGRGTSGPADVAALGDAVARAQGHAAAGDLPAAVATLHGPLSHLDPTVAPTAQAVDAAALYAHVLAGTGYLGPALQWATWAYQVSQALYDRADPRALRPAQIHAAVLAATGNTAHAVTAYHDLVDMLTVHDGTTGMRTLHARADLAVALHHHGSCPVAHATLDDTWVLCRTRHGRNHPVAVRMCARLAIMYRDCGDPNQARLLFAQARHDAAGTPLDGPVTTAASRPANPAHQPVCTHTPGTTRIHWPPTEPSHHRRPRPSTTRTPPPPHGPERDQQP